MREPEAPLEHHVRPVTSARLRQELNGVFPELADCGSALELYAVVTVQECHYDLVSRSQGAEREKNSHCERFLTWGRAVAEAVRGAGGWADMPDPATGYPVLGRRGGLAHNELECVQRVLKFSSTQVGSCCVLEHPRWGTRCYPASLFVAVAEKATLDRAIQAADAFDATAREEGRAN